MHLCPHSRVKSRQRPLKLTSVIEKYLQATYGSALITLFSSEEGVGKVKLRREPSFMTRRQFIRYPSWEDAGTGASGRDVDMLPPHLQSLGGRRQCFGCVGCISLCCDQGYLTMAAQGEWFTLVFSLRGHVSSWWQRHGGKNMRKMVMESLESGREQTQVDWFIRP